MSDHVTDATTATAPPAVLVLEDGRAFRGRGFGAVGRTLGEVVFSTAMTGYQESLTDPSFHRQIVVSTAPQIGNTGWNDEDGESACEPGRALAVTGEGGRIWVAGYVIRDLSRRASNWRSERTLEAEMVAQGIVGIRQVDTRALVRHIRTAGSMKGGIFSGDEALLPTGELVEIVRAQPSMAGADLAGEVTTPTAYVVEPTDGVVRSTVVALDMGIKANTPRLLAARGIRVHVVPASTTFEEVMDFDPDGVFLSNGPGDPATATDQVQLARAVMGQGLPLFGICFGNQILGRALGLETYKMRFGHRGVNIPVIEHSTGLVSITSQNHGFALEGEAGQRFETPFGTAEISHTCANDGSVEGVRLLDGSAFSVQYHPEAASGPHDAVHLFDKFADMLGARSGKATN